MSLAFLFSQLDANLLTISGIFFTVWLTIHFSLFEVVGDLQVIRNTSICAIANQNSSTELIPFISTLRERSYVLVLEPQKRSKSLRKVLILFAFASVLAICHKPIPSFVSFWPDADLFYFFYIFTLGAASTYLWIEVKYFREFRRLERDYPTSSIEPKKLHFMVE